MLTLDTDITKINRVGVATAKKLKKIGINSIQDLLFYFPFRYDDFSEVTPIAELKPGTSANIVGQIELIQNKRSPRKRMYITEALISDETEQIKAIWFNQPFIGRTLHVGERVSLSGKIEDDYGSFAIKSPVYEKISSFNVHTQGLVPNYHLTANLTQKQVRFLIKQIVSLADSLSDWLPEEIVKSQKLLKLSTAIKTIHFPNDLTDIQKAKERLGFDELFLVQLQAELTRQQTQKNQAPRIKFHEKETKNFVDSLPFKLTNAQKKSAWEILQDLQKNQPMSRLLQGDVGSGKTVVALIAMLNTALNNKQAVLMVPTEILAEQHFNSICKLMKSFNINIGLITGSTKKFNQQIKKEEKINSKFIIHNSKIIIGTHALIQEKIEFQNLGLAIIDEQHRFGVNQRSALMRTNADYVQTNAGSSNVQQNSDKEKLLYEDLSYLIRAAIFKVKKELGLGHKEVIYQNALEQEFIINSINYQKEKIINIKYNGKKIGTYRPDFIIDNKIILELKKLPFVGKIERNQVWHYLKGSDYKLALLINFGKEDVEIERIIYDTSRKNNLSSQHPVNIQSTSEKSASVCAQSARVSVCPHLLSMTATPIPRSLALALFGDLNLSIINEMPSRRQPIITRIVDEANRAKAYEFIRAQIKLGRQVFVICPLIDISDQLGVKSVKEEYEKLDQQIFPDLKIAMLHGRLKSAEKEKVMQEFLDNKINILVSTSVVEVGIDVPNASIMMIEGADRFGLAQLHQFRGRVGRDVHQSYCFLFSESESPKTLNRLQALIQYNDGFTLAKIDLKHRGPGEVYGLAQKGFPELKIASLFDYELTKKARTTIDELIKKDPELKNYPELKEKLGEWSEQVHLE